MNWISVDQPPSSDEYCLVFADGAIACRSWNSKKREWEDWTNAQNPNVMNEFITHYMFLPEPPKN
jgi:hypothetical protein